jgi:hypothetical protein
VANKFLYDNTCPSGLSFLSYLFGGKLLSLFGGNVLSLFGGKLLSLFGGKL